jgi:hypothetical protein
LVVVSPAGPRASIRETPQGLEIVIPARRSAIGAAILGVWLCGWAMGEAMAIGTLLTGVPDAGATLFLVAWLGAWTLGGGFALCALLWMLKGRERILLTPARLCIERELFGIGRSREYERIHVRELRFSPAAYSPFDFRSGLQFWGVGGGAIAFDHGSATVRFGAALEEAEARAIVERLRRT